MNFIQASLRGEESCPARLRRAPVLAPPCQRSARLFLHSSTKNWESRPLGSRDRQYDPSTPSGVVLMILPTSQYSIIDQWPHGTPLPKIASSPSRESQDGLRRPRHAELACVGWTTERSDEAAERGGSLRGTRHPPPCHLSTWTCLQIQERACSAAGCTRWRIIGSSRYAVFATGIARGHKAAPISSGSRQVTRTQRRVVIQANGPGKRYSACCWPVCDRIRLPEA